MTRKDLRPCLLNGERHYFHRWFQEGGFDTNSNGMDGTIDIGALLEDGEGNLKKVWDFSLIKFDVV